MYARIHALSPRCRGVANRVAAGGGVVGRGEGDGLATAALRAAAPAAITQTVRDSLGPIGHECVAAEHNLRAPIAVGTRE
jgi:hypothetical protein